jgi:aspartyl-tRNA(Asn)/glutamyl-tRNA(Gln) amidotransferase subunit B
VSFVDAAMPGMLPVVNKFCIEQAVKTGLALNAQINKYSVFDRKNYFYPDLPQGYQISQFSHPIVGEGVVTVDMPHNTVRHVGIERLHVEQDAGKSIHDAHPTMSLIDLNRSGTALMEIVTKPDMRASDEAVAFLKKLRTILRYIETCDGNMDQGSMRADVNVSVRKIGAELGTRCEIKNVNSMKFVQVAIEYEARRQIQILEDGGVIDQETRLFDPKTGETRTMRSKEDAHDYRYFPDPDLLPLQLTDDMIADIKSKLPELPDVKKQRFIDDYGLTAYDASVLTAEKELSIFFEQVAKNHDAKLAANWIMGDFMAAINKNNLTLDASPVTAKQLSSLVACISDGTISSKIAKNVFEIMWNDGGMAHDIVEKHNLKQVTDMGAIEQAIDDVIASSPENVAAYRDGKTKLIGWFVGQVMKNTGGKANPDAVNEILKQKLGG